MPHTPDTLEHDLANLVLAQGGGALSTVPERDHLRRGVAHSWALIAEPELEQVACGHSDRALEGKGALHLVRCAMNKHDRNAPSSHTSHMYIDLADTPNFDIYFADVQQSNAVLVQPVSGNDPLCKRVSRGQVPA